MNTVQNGKGRGPEKGRNLPAFRAGYDEIEWDTEHCRGEDKTVLREVDKGAAKSQSQGNSTVDWSKL